MPAHLEVPMLTDHPPGVCAAGPDDFWVSRLIRADYPELRSRSGWQATMTPIRRLATSRSGVRYGAHAELVALGVGHDHVVVFGIAVVSDERGPEPGQALDLGGLVAGVQVKVHLVPGGNRSTRHL